MAFDLANRRGVVAAAERVPALCPLQCGYRRRGPHLSKPVCGPGGGFVIGEIAAHPPLSLRAVQAGKRGYGAPLRVPDRRRVRDRELAERSEEHTSELQSRQYLVCRLLLETKPIL